MTGECETLIQKNLTEGDKEHFKINSLNNEQGISGDDCPLENRKKTWWGATQASTESVISFSFSFESHSYRNAPLIHSTACSCILFY